MGREEQKRMMTFFLRMVREAFMYNFQQAELSYMTSKEEGFCVKFSRFVNERNVLGFQELYQNAMREIGQNANSSMVFFEMAMKVGVLLHATRK
jgi:DNA polymerase-3 subunit delta'